MSSLYDCADPQARDAGLRHAAGAILRGALVVLPTDTVYGVGADAFSAAAVQALLDAKGRSRAMPPPVLVGSVRTLDGLADAVPDVARALVERFWPGGLTLVLRAQPSLDWDLGETHGTVAVRMPDHELALELLRTTGPLAVSSANLTGRPAATSAAAAREQLGDAVECYLDDGRGAGAHGAVDGIAEGDAGGDAGGAAAAPTASTIVDVTGDGVRLLRPGTVGLDALREVAGDVEVPDG